MSGGYRSDGASAQISRCLFVLSKLVEIEFDPAKSARNDKERGLPFERAAELDWDRALAFADDRRDYGEKRIIALAPMRARLHVVCYVIRGHARRIISFRKASRREEKRYEQATTDR